MSWVRFPAAEDPFGAAIAPPCNNCPRVIPCIVLDVGCIQQRVKREEIPLLRQYNKACPLTTAISHSIAMNYGSFIINIIPKPKSDV